MSTHIHKLGCMAVVSLATLAWHSAQAQSGSSLGDARLGVIKGTSPGITLIGRNPTPEASSSAASAPVGGSTAPVQRPVQGATAPAAGMTNSASAGSGWGALLRSLPAPQGNALSSAKRLDSPSLGIAVPSAASAPAKTEERPAPQPAPAAR